MTGRRSLVDTHLDEATALITPERRWSDGDLASAAHRLAVAMRSDGLRG